MNEQKNMNPAQMPTVEVRIDRLTGGDSKVKAFASATIGGCFAIHGIRVVETDKGRFVSMPQNTYMKGNERQYSDIFHPITAQARMTLIQAVNMAYEQKLTEQMQQIAGQLGQAAPESPSAEPSQNQDAPEDALEQEDAPPEMGMKMG